MKVREVLSQILNKFESGEIPEAIAYSVYPPMDVPSNKWSFLNRMLMYWSGTNDARGYRQWQEAGRQVKKGSKAIYILAPRVKKIKNEETEDYYLIGFLSIPVFRAEDTEGEPLEYERNELPEFPLMDRAKEWGLSVVSTTGGKGFYGTYNQTEGKIELATKEESVFFHELSHHAHKLILGELKPGQDWDKSRAYHRYERKQNWYAEWKMRFKNAWLHRQLIKKGMNPILGIEPINALVYGGWDFDTVINSAMYEIWGWVKKKEYEKGVRPFK